MSKISRRDIVGGAITGTIVAGTGSAEAAPSGRRPQRADVCVVGAGFAGLAAAYRLKQAGLDVVLLEARKRVGGRSWSVRLKDGAFVDFGGQWVGSSQSRFYALIKEMGGETYPSPDFGKTLHRGILNTDEYHRIGEEGEDTFPGAKLVNDGSNALDAIAKTVDPEAPWKHPDAALLDSITFAEWLRQNVENESARRFIGAEAGSVPCASPEEISVLHLAWLIRACDGLKELYGDAQKDGVIGGTQTVARRVAENLGPSIKLGQPVRKIEWNDKGAIVHSDQISIAARHVIVAIPPNLAGAIEYEPSLPVNRVQVTQRWPQGLVIKVAMIYSEPFWRRDGLNGTSYDHISVIGETVDSSNPETISKAGILTGFVYTDNARKVAPMAPEERKKLLLDEVAKRFGPKALTPEHYHESNWSTEVWTRGCFTGFLTPGATTLFGAAVREPVGPIRWAGTETSTQWPSFIDGAIRSGEREAAAIAKISNKVIAPA
jgi:monoamine oxidase